MSASLSARRGGQPSNDHADTPAVRFAPGRDAEKPAKRVAHAARVRQTSRRVKRRIFPLLRRGKMPPRCARLDRELHHVGRRCPARNQGLVVDPARAIQSDINDAVPGQSSFCAAQRRPEPMANPLARRRLPITWGAKRNNQACTRSSV